MKSSFTTLPQSPSRRKEAGQDNTMHLEHDNLSSPFVVTEWPGKTVDSQWDFLALGAVINKEMLTLGIAFVLGLCVLYRVIGLNSLGASARVRDDKGNAIPNGPNGLPLIGETAFVHHVCLFINVCVTQDHSPF